MFRMSGGETSCDNFNQHAWKKDICTNCLKHLSCHGGRVNNTNANQGENLDSLREQNNEYKQTFATKSCKTKSPASQGGNSAYIAESGAARQVTQEETHLSESSNCVPDQPKSMSNYYEIYDIAAKGQSGKPVDLDSHDDDSQTEGCTDHQNPCLMATPYTVVDVITMSLEKSRQSNNMPHTAPSLPLTPAPDPMKKNQPTKGVLVLEEKSPKSISEERVDKNSIFNSASYHPRVYEEIDELFWDTLASKKFDLEEDTIKENKIITSNNVKTTDSNANKTFEHNQKSIVKQEKSKKSGSKSFLQKLLGKSNRDEELSKNKGEGCVKKDSVDDKSLATSAGLSESLLNDTKTIKVGKSKKSEADESASVSDMLNQTTCISEDFAKEIEEKFETLSRKSKLSSTEIMERSTSCRSEISNDSCEKDSNEPMRVFSSLDGIIGTLPNRKSVVQGTSRKDASSNRKSMTPAEAKLARKMLVAPPPPPICSSSTSLASVADHSDHKDGTPNSAAQTPSSYFMSLQRQPNQTNEVITPHSSSKVTPEPTTRNSLMDDLDEILMKNGMKGNASTLPKSYISNQNQAAGKLSLAIDDLSSTKFNGSSNIVQQRALPELPHLPPPAARLHKTSLSPESENLYESLPHSEDLLLPYTENAFDKSSENTSNNLPMKSDSTKADFPVCKSEPIRKLNRPRPAPRAAIRTINATKVKDVNIILEHNDSCENENLTLKNMHKLGSFRLEETFEEKCSIVSTLTLKSLQLFMDKFISMPSLISIPLKLFSNLSWKQKEVEIVKSIECKSPVLMWKKVAFFQIVVNNFYCLLMVRTQISTNSIPKYNHRNLINSLHSFIASAELSDCRSLFGSSHEKDRRAEKTKYAFDVLPYSRISPFPSLSFCISDISPSDFTLLLPHNISKIKALTLLQIFDSVLHLHKSGVDLYRLHPSDILLVSPLESVSSFKDTPDSSHVLLPILVPLECGEYSPRMDQKLLCHDLTKITNFIVSTSKSSNGSPSASKQSETLGREVPKTNICQSPIQVPQPRTRQTSVSLDKNDRCLRKVERILESGNSWLQICTAINYLEFSIWGPSEEDVKLALMPTQKIDMFNWWVGSSRAELLVDLMQDPIISLLQQLMQVNDATQILGNESHLQHISLMEWQSNFETTRKAEFLKCDQERLLDIAKEMFR